MRHDLRSNNVRLLVGYLMVFSMESHQLIPQRHKKPHFLGVFFTAVPPLPRIHHPPSLLTGLETFSNLALKVAKASSCKGILVAP
jgi:hypothetical protein